MVELFLMGCTGVVMFLHGANFFFHLLSHHFAIRSLRIVFPMWDLYSQQSIMFVPILIQWLTRDLQTSFE
ncbi:hypothetical protein LguiB_034058 [Lonicera macranthoides]